MSDLTPETTAATATVTETPTPDPSPPPDPAAAPTVDLTPIENRLDSLESRVTALETAPAKPALSTADVFTPSAAGSGFDAQAREAELVSQGISEEDAASQALYEQRLYDDQHKPSA